jgi:hypothetical protein
VPLLSRFTGLRRLCAGPEDRPGRLGRVIVKSQRLQLPLPFKGNIAVLEPGFRIERGMREFGADLQRVEDFRPEVIVAPLHIALILADQKLWGLLQLPSLGAALVVLTRLSPMEQHDRDLLWRAFGVPVFEQLRDSGGIIIARECEVHDGLHLAGAAEAPGIPCELVTGHCECGAETPRIRKLAPARQMAAAAAA